MQRNGSEPIQEISLSTDGKMYVNAESLSSALDNTEICTFMYYPKTRLLVIPQKARQRYQLEKYYSNAPWGFAKDHVCDSDRTAFIRMYTRIDQGEKMSSAQFCSKDGLFHMKVTLTVIAADGEGCPAEVIGIVEDVTDLANSEHQVAAAERESLIARSIAAAAGLHYSAIFYVSLQTGRYMMYSEANITGFRPEQNEGDFRQDIDHYIRNEVISEDRRAMLRFTDLSTLTGRLREQNPLNCVYRSEADGWIRSSFVPAKQNENGEITDVLMTVLNIDAEKRAEQEHEKIVYQAQHDELTDLYNRSFFQELISSERLENVPVGFILMDVDKFKSINDLYGHVAGDHTLMKVAETLSSAFRKQDYVFRLGGDEFGVLLYDCKRQGWDTICRKIGDVHARLQEDDAEGIAITLSCGICFSDKGFHPELYRMADKALYCTKEKGRAGCTLIELDGTIRREWHDSAAALQRKHVLETSNTGTWRIEIPDEPDALPRMYGDDVLHRLLGADAEISPEDFYALWYQRIDPDYVAVVQKTVKMILETSHAEVSYPWHHPQKGKVMVRCGGTNDPTFEGGKCIYGYHQDINDTSVVEKNDDSHQLMEAVGSIFFASCYFNILSNDYIVLKETQPLAEVLRDCTCADQALERITEHLIHQEDREKMRRFLQIETLRERLQWHGFISCEYRSLSGYGWCRAMLFPVKGDADGQITHILLATCSINEEKEREIARQREGQERIHLQMKAAEVVTQSKNIVVAVIDQPSATVRFTDNNLNIPIDQSYSYQEMMEKEFTHAAKEERDRLCREMELPNVVEQLKRHGSFAKTADIESNDGIKHSMVYHFTEYNAEKHQILLVIEDVTRQITRDVLTHELNMDGFVRFLQQTISDDGKSYSVLAFNIRKFKVLNELYGYEGGDYVLKQVARRLKSSGLKPLAICREMSDHFFCLVQNENVDYSEIEDLCRMNVQIKDFDCTIMLSCGIYHVGSRAMQVQTLCDRARIALKSGNANQSTLYAVFDSEMEQNYMAEANVVHLVDNAIAQHQFVVHYQPIYDAITHKITSAEALVRWAHPERGIIAPAAFIPALEKHGQISELDLYVAEEVQKLQEDRCRRKAAMIPIAVNLSRADFFKQSAIKKVLQSIEQTTVSPDYLRFEITESCFLDIPEVGEAFLRCLKEKGSHILIDDFGSGVSSLGCLAEREFDVVKLDMSFVQKIGTGGRAESIIKASIDLSHQLGAKMVAEGVETEEQYQFLRSSGCDYIQGFYFCKPLPREAFEQLLDRQRN